MAEIDRPIVDIDVETTGLQDNKNAVVIELAYMTDGMTRPKVLFPFGYDGEYGLTMPKKNIWVTADPKAMEINRFYERYPDGVEPMTPQEFDEFMHVVKGATISGANIRFDAAMIMRTLFKRWDPEPWHHRMFDLQSVAAGAFGWNNARGWAETIAAIKTIDEDLTNYESSSAMDSKPEIFVNPDHSASADCFSNYQARQWLRWYARNVTSLG